MTLPLKVTYFHRKPRPTGNFSIEEVFETVRTELAEVIEPRICEAPFCSNGIIKRLKIILHARKHQSEINHITGDINFVALGLDGRRTVLTNHDCGFMHSSRGLKRWLLRRYWIELPIKHVAAVTTVSNFSKEELVQFSGCSPDKVHVIPNAVPRHFRPVHKEFNTRAPRVLHIGTTPNKNLRRLVDALTGLPCTLVIVGAIDKESQRKIGEANISHENYVNLSTSEIVHQYCKCDLVAFVSLYEGFGVPILEAQAVGRSVITSNRAPMSDIAGGGAYLVDPENIAEIREAIVKAISDQIGRERLIETGFQNVKRFSPENIAQKYHAVYQKVLANVND